jgi:hypothetical protein
MSDTLEPGAGAHAGGHAGARSEEDRVSTPAILGVGVAALVLFFLASLVTVSFWREKMDERGPVAVPPETGQSKIGLVEQQLFELTVRGERDRARKLERLGSYGWVDRAAGVAHIPIEEAMRLVAAGVRPGPLKGDASPPAPEGQP